MRSIYNRIRIGTEAPGQTTAQIVASLNRSLGEAASTIEVECIDGMVILRGTAASLLVKDFAEEIAWRDTGVSQVENRLVVEG